MEINNKPVDIEGQKDLVRAYKKVFLDENGKFVGDGAKIIKDLIRLSEMYIASGNMDTDHIVRSKARQDVVIYIMENIFYSLDYFDELAKLSVGEDYV